MIAPNASAVAMHADAREREVEMALDIEEREVEYDVYLYWHPDPLPKSTFEDEDEGELEAFAQSDEENVFESAGYNTTLRSGLFIERLSYRLDTLLRRFKAMLSFAGQSISRPSFRF